MYSHWALYHERTMMTIVDVVKKETVESYCEKHWTDKKNAEDLFEEVIKFLSICANSKRWLAYSPSRIVDDMRHILLENNNYVSLCQTLFGKNIWHYPMKDWLLKKYNNARNAILEKYWTCNKVFRPEQSFETKLIADCAWWE